MPITLYNTLSRSKEVFTPITPGRVGIYTCGPTVYNFAHIGNLRTFLFEDLLVRMLRFTGLEVTWVMNVTDVGHQTSDGDEGEDKFAGAVRRENLDPYTIARKYEDHFLADMDRLGIHRPDIIPRATEHVAQMIALNQRLEEKGYTYQTTEGLYFDTSKVPDYGKLARTRLDEQRTMRDDVNVDTAKRNQADFILWFSNKPNHVMKWDSPWGVGYPGWHIECSAMSMAYLGETFDIHCGGNDHIPVHHTNEIVQSECATGHVFAHYWMHTAFLTLGAGAKMAKSKGNFLSVQALINSGYDPLAYRYLCLQAHYRSELELAWDWDGEGGTGRAPSLDTAAASLKRLYERVARTDDEPLTDPAAYASARAEVLGYLTDDLNVPRAVGALHSYGSPRLWREFDAVLGLDFENQAVRKDEEPVEVPENVLSLLEERQAARKSRDFARADAIRTELAAQGWEIADTPEGAKVKPIAGG
jgi:cysteinyl-tRNA synthetase